ncbi:MarR family transcriptional regulator [Phycicoccus sp. SLBN-51]|uniref:GbsR/MarR family transcriptional regulator n=1 Tax=Phycicoccus sp. SLBN-51 TaxID=2768447 RepID=UPI001153A70A|nr:MarR family transcriptional regulator [Phycicoccus sp. SLBN-51]TQJ51877.1 MarR family protein [Phycicoccus sp. SLBN-51]
MSSRRVAPAPARFVERFGSALTAAGMPRLPARVFACLLADDDGAMTAAELGEALEVSPASVSGAVRYLQQVRMIHRERQPGTRRDLYVVADDAWHDAVISAGQVYQPLRAVLAEGVDVVGGERTTAGRRLALSAEFLDFLTEEFEGVARRWEKRRAELTG